MEAPALSRPLTHFNQTSQPEPSHMTWLRTWWACPLYKMQSAVCVDMQHSWWLMNVCVSQDDVMSSVQTFPSCQDTNTESRHPNRVALQTGIISGVDICPSLLWGNGCTAQERQICTSDSRNTETSDWFSRAKFTTSFMPALDSLGFKAAEKLRKESFSRAAGLCCGCKNK